MAYLTLLPWWYREEVLAQGKGVAETVWVILAQAGPWGLVVGILGWITWMYATDRIISRGRHREALEEKDFWRSAAMMTSEMGELLGKAKATTGATIGRRDGDSDDELAAEIQMLRREVSSLRSSGTSPEERGRDEQ